MWFIAIFFYVLCARNNNKIFCDIKFWIEKVNRIYCSCCRWANCVSWDRIEKRVENTFKVTEKTLLHTAVKMTNEKTEGKWEKVWAFKTIKVCLFIWNGQERCGWRQQKNGAHTYRSIKNTNANCICAHMCVICDLYEWVSERARLQTIWNRILVENNFKAIIKRYVV